MIFDERDLGCAAAECFDTDGAGAGETVDESRAGDEPAQNIEECFAKAIACGAQVEAFEAFSWRLRYFPAMMRMRVSYLTDPREMIAALPLARQNAKDSMQASFLTGSSASVKASLRANSKNSRSRSGLAI